MECTDFRYIGKVFDIQLGRMRAMQMVRFMLAISFAIVAMFALILRIFGSQPEQIRHVYTNLGNHVWPNWPKPLIKSEWALIAGNGELRLERLYAKGSWPGESWNLNGWFSDRTFRYAPHYPLQTRLKSPDSRFASGDTAWIAFTVERPRLVIGRSRCRFGSFSLSASQPPLTFSGE